MQRERYRRGDKRSNHVSVLIYLTLDVPRHTIIAVYVTVVCAIVFLMVGSLCGRHWYLAATGGTVIGRMQGEGHASSNGSTPFKDFILDVKFNIIWDALIQ